MYVDIAFITNYLPYPKRGENIMQGRKRLVRDRTAII